MQVEVRDGVIVLSGETVKDKGVLLALHNGGGVLKHIVMHGRPDCTWQLVLEIIPSPRFTDSTVTVGGKTIRSAQSPVIDFGIDPDKDRAADRVKVANGTMSSEDVAKAAAERAAVRAQVADGTVSPKAAFDEGFEDGLAVLCGRSQERVEAIVRRVLAEAKGERD